MDCRAFASRRLLNDRGEDEPTANTSGGSEDAGICSGALGSAGPKTVILEGGGGASEDPNCADYSDRGLDVSEGNGSTFAGPV